MKAGLIYGHRTRRRSRIGERESHACGRISAWEEFNFDNDDLSAEIPPCSMMEGHHKPFFKSFFDSLSARLGDVNGRIFLVVDNAPRHKRSESPFDIKKIASGLSVFKLYR